VEARLEQLEVEQTLAAGVEAERVAQRGREVGRRKAVQHAARLLAI
jgi:hypothetical protein